MNSEPPFESRVGVVVLAAGESKRLGFPKQLAEIFPGKTLLSSTVESALTSDAHSVLVILGHRAAEIQKCLPEHERLRFSVNQEWPEGMGSSIRLAAQLVADSDLSGLILSVCDQPAIGPAVFDRLIKAHAENQRAFIASRYDSGTRGVPVLIPRCHFPLLGNCRGDRGLRDVLQTDDAVVEVDFPGGDHDIDTPDDLVR